MIKLNKWTKSLNMDFYGFGYIYDPCTAAVYNMQICKQNEDDSVTYYVYIIYRTSNVLFNRTHIQ